MVSESFSYSFVHQAQMSFFHTGNIGLDDLYSCLLEAREKYAEQMRIEILEEDQRQE